MMVMLGARRRCRVEVLLCRELLDTPDMPGRMSQQALVTLWKPSSVELGDA
jgi:hypothetical protein